MTDFINLGVFLTHDPIIRVHEIWLPGQGKVRTFASNKQTPGYSAAWPSAKDECVEVEDGAFQDCSLLELITIPSTVTQPLASLGGAKRGSFCEVLIVSFG